MTSYRPSDYELTREERELEQAPKQARFGLSGWSRWIWRQLTSMKTALVLLLLLAIASVPGSVYPQRSADPNGVRLQFEENPELAQVLDALQLFDVYTSVWFSAIYILLFISLIGCVIPRTQVHWRAMRAKPVKTPVSLKKMSAYIVQDGNKADLERAAKILKKQGYRVDLKDDSVSAEKGYLRETGNLVFHYALIAVLIAVGVGGGNSYIGQRVLVEGDMFVNNLAGYDSFSPGTFYDPDNLYPFSMRLDDFEVSYDLQNPANIGTPIDFEASVTVFDENGESPGQVKVNQPLELPGTGIYLMGNGFAPVITVRDGDGRVAFSGPVIFLPQDGNMTSLGVIKAPDANPEQIGLISFFYPTAEQLPSGAYTSIYPDPFDPLLTVNAYIGDLGLDEGVPRNVYALDVSEMNEVAGRNADNPGLVLAPGERAEIPGGYGSVSFDGLTRFAAFDIAHNPGGFWILLSSLVALGGLIVSLLIPRRRVWVKAVGDEKIELAALARGDDPRLEDVVSDLGKKLAGGKVGN